MLPSPQAVGSSGCTLLCLGQQTRAGSQGELVSFHQHCSFTEQPGNGALWVWHLLESHSSDYSWNLPQISLSSEKKLLFSVYWKVWDWVTFLLILWAGRVKVCLHLGVENMVRTGANEMTAAWHENNMKHQSGFPSCQEAQQRPDPPSPPRSSSSSTAQSGSTGEQQTTQLTSLCRFSIYKMKGQGITSTKLTNTNRFAIASHTSASGTLDFGVEAAGPNRGNPQSYTVSICS